MKFLLLLFPILMISILIILVSNVIKSYRLSNLRFKKIDEWSNLNQNMIDWGNEIIDPNTKQEYLMFCVSKLNESLYSNFLDNPKKMDKYTRDLKDEIIEKYANYIPSLKQIIREEKLKTLLK